MKYSLRSLMIVVTLVAVGFGTVLGWLNYERERIQNKWDVCQRLRSKGVQLGSGPLPRPWEQMWTWRGCETIDYVKLCTIYEPKELGSEDLADLVSTFPEIEDAAVIRCDLTSEQLRRLAMLPRLKKLSMYNSAANREDQQWIETHRPDVQFLIEYIP